MNLKFVVVILIISMVSTSCIPKKELVYLQNKEKATDSTQVISEKQMPYRVQINDILNIRVKALDQANVQIFNPIGEENLNADSAQRAYFDGFTVDLHGNIRVPILGEINVLGFTTEELEDIIEKKLLEEQFKETANLFVTVKLTGLKFTASGEVGNPGTKVLFQARVNVFEAIANSGEIPVTGNRKSVKVIRQYPDGQKIHALDLTDIDVMNSPYYYIQPNDIIYVEPLKQKTWGTGVTGIQTLGTIISALSIVTTAILIINRI